MSDEIKLPSFINVHAVMPVQKGVGKNGKPYEIQKASVSLLDENGELLQAGVLRVPNSAVGKLKPGVYAPGFGMRIDFQNNEVIPVMNSLLAVPSRNAPVTAPVAAPKA